MLGIRSSSRYDSRRSSAWSSSKERRSDRGRREAADLRRAVGRELRESRMTLNLSLAAVGREVGISVSQLSRVERGLAPGVPLDRIAATGAVLGLKLSVRFYP